MPNSLMKIGEKAVIGGITMICTESPCKGCSMCDVLNMDEVCDNWLCEAKHRPDGKDTMMVAERRIVDGKTYLMVPYSGCDRCAFYGNNADEQPCSGCESGMDMYKVQSE